MTRFGYSLLGIAYSLRSIIAVGAALVVGVGLVILAGGNPLQAYAALFSGAFLDYWGFASTLVRMAPILLAGLAVIIPMRAGLFNIGGEGQIYMGALMGTLAALNLPETIPLAVRLPVIVLAGACAGGLWALIPAVLKAYRGVNEVISSLLLSYVAINVVGAVIRSLLMEKGAPFPYSKEVPADVILPVLLPQTQVHAGVAAAIVLALCIAIVLKRTTFGLAIEIVGHNPTSARYAGINIKRMIMTSFFVGGSLAGLAGVFEVIGLRYRLFDQFSPGYGLQGIIVAFLASLNPLIAIITALFLAGLQAGAGSMQRTTGLDTTMVEALQGLIVLFVAVGLAFRQWRRPSS
ncbi:MAG: ABC transporter permease [Parvibaculaceae bacterium]